MSQSELDAFRAELLRQKIVFESELRRQREATEDRLEYLSKQLSERESENRSLRVSLTIMGKKVDALQEQIIRVSSCATAKRSGSAGGGRGASEARANSPSVVDRPCRHGSPVPQLRMPSPVSASELVARDDNANKVSRAPSLFSRAQSGSRPASPGATPRSSVGRDSPAAHRPLLGGASKSQRPTASAATVPTVKRIVPGRQQASPAAGT